MNLASWVSVPMMFLVGAALLLVAKAVAVLRMPGFSGREAFAFMLLAVALWAFGDLFDVLPVSPPTRSLAAALTWTAILATSGLWLMFVWQYVKGGMKPLPVLWLMPQLVMIILTVGIALTNSRHHLLSAPDGGPHGPWYFVVATYVSGLVLLSLALIGDAIQRSRGVYRRQYIGIFAAMLLPGLVGLGSQSGWITLFDSDPTPISVLLMGLIVSRLIGRNQLFNLVPIARTILVDAIPDPVLVLDRAYQVLDANAAAFGLAGVTQRLIGCTLSEVAVIGPLLSGAETGEPLPTDVTLGQPERHFEVTLIPLQHGGRQVGTVLMLRDITRRARLETRLRELATRDTLTGLHNRRLLEEIGGRLVDEADQMGQKLAVMTLDLDHFKRLNDHHGHRAGDLVLRSIGGFLLERVRQTDFVFRTGGEEILILLPGANALQAMSRIEEWRREFTATEIAIGSDGRVQISFSAGVAIYPDDGPDLETVLLYADKALYRAKDQGRNCACLWSGIGGHDLVNYPQ